jgi:hypothetical protein
LIFVLFADFLQVHARSKKPDIILIVVDDMGCGHFETVVLPTQVTIRDLSQPLKNSH